MKESPPRLSSIKPRLHRRGQEPFSRRDPDERRRSILEAARTALAAGDYHTVTMDDVARAAGVAKGSLYLHFPNKEQLFQAVVGDTHARLWARWREVAGRTPAGIDRLRAFVREQLDFFEQNRPLFLQVFLGQLPLQCLPRRGLAGIVRDNVSVIETLVREAMRRKELRSANASITAIGLFGLIRGFVFSDILGETPLPLSGRANDIWTLFFEGARP